MRWQPVFGILLLVGLSSLVGVVSKLVWPQTVSTQSPQPAVPIEPLTHGVAQAPPKDVVEVRVRPVHDPVRLKANVRNVAERVKQRLAPPKKVAPPPSPLLNGDVPEGPWILIIKSENRAYLMEDNTVVRSFPCATGRSRTEDGPDFTPVGWFHITNERQPTAWNPSPRIRKEYGLPLHGKIPPGDPRNALGAAWLGINVPAIGLHGTNDPSRIGTFDTHGCVAFHNEDIAAIAAEVQVGTPVCIQEK